MQISKQNAQITINKLFTTNTRSNNLIKIYRGLTFTIARDLPFTGIFFPLFSSIKQFNVFETQFKNNMFAGMISGAVSATIVTPIDSMKTKYQINNNKTMTQIINQTTRTQLFNGLLPRVCAISIMYAITASLFEFQKKYLIK